MAENRNPNERARGPQVFDMTSQQCIWAAAGVVPFRMCSNAFDCTTCAFDHAMRVKAARQDDYQTWPGKQTKVDLESKRCRHMISGYVSRKYCSHNFNCVDCQFDQLVEAEMRALEPEEPVVELISGFGLAPFYYYQGGHTWARVEYGGQVRVGMDDFATRLLGPPSHWSLPSLGAALGQGTSEVELERDGHSARLLSPLQGVVTAVNQRLEQEPQLAHEAPYGSGWLMILQPTRLAKNLTSLLYGQQAENWLASEADRLNQFIHRHEPHPPMATGGRVIPDLYGSIPDLDWDQLVSGFLLT